MTSDAFNNISNEEQDVFARRVILLVSRSLNVVFLECYLSNKSLDFEVILSSDSIILDQLVIESHIRESKNLRIHSILLLEANESMSLLLQHLQ